MIRFACIAVLLLSSVASAQQRPLLTEDVDIIPPGSIRIEAGIDFMQGANYSVSGLRGDLTRVGVIGINFYDRFLLPPGETRRATLADVVTHMKHICDLAGSTRHVAIGTDMDGGLGRDQIPVEITTSADLPKLADALSDGGFTDTDVTNIMSANWARYFAEYLADGQS